CERAVTGRLRHERSDHYVASFRTTAACFRTNAAMFHVHFASMTLALVRTRTAGLRACVQLQMERGRVAVAGACEQLTSDVADIGAVLVQPNALCERGAGFFRQARVRADRADFRAIKTSFNASD